MKGAAMEIQTVTRAMHRQYLLSCRIAPFARAVLRDCHPGLVLLAALAAGAPAQAHWCNSGARLTNIGQAICSDASLVNKDIELNRLYSALGGTRNAALKISQRQWMNSRNRCTSMDCLHSYYDDRLRVLRSRAGAPAASPAPTYTPPPALENCPRSSLSDAGVNA